MPDYDYHSRCFNAGYSVTMNGPLASNIIRQPYMTKSTRLAYEAGVAAAREVKAQQNAGHVDQTQPAPQKGDYR